MFPKGFEIVSSRSPTCTPLHNFAQEANVPDFQTVAKDIDTLTAVLQLRSSQVVRWKASDQDHPAIRTAGGAAQRPWQQIAEKDKLWAILIFFNLPTRVAEKGPI